MSGTFEINSSIRQGDVLPPTLFNLPLDNASSTGWEKNGENVGNV